MLGMPAETAYDLKFRLLGIPVRVHPFFWLVVALLGGVGTRTVEQVVIWMACVFVSVLVHEFGHGLMAGAFGYPARIALYGMGGLCDSDGRSQSPRERLFIVLAGPGAGFVLFGLVLVFVFAMFRVTPVEALSLLVNGNSEGAFQAVIKMSRLGSPGIMAILFLLEINLFWGILNLLPIWPLDGGQVAGIGLTAVNRWNGRRWTHVISLLVAGSLALLSYMKLNDMLLALFFGFFAFTNYQVLSILHAQSKYGLSDEGW
jgi:Zn-dependent protease